jgi:hypothetical protein
MKSVVLLGSAALCHANLLVLEPDPMVIASNDALFGYPKYGSSGEDLLPPR